MCTIWHSQPVLLCSTDVFCERRKTSNILAILVENGRHEDDGVKVNYPKFYPLVEPIKGLESNEDE